MELEAVSPGELSPSKENEATDELAEIRDLVSSFVRNRPVTGQKTRHDIVLRNLTVRGAGIGVSLAFSQVQCTIIDLFP